MSRTTWATNKYQVDSSDARYVELTKAGSNPEASIADITVSGTVRKALPTDPALEATITLENETLKKALTDQNARGWFSDKPAGVTITANATAGDDAITLTFGGTPTAAFTETFDIEIPASILTGGKGLLVTENPDARWDINADDETASYTITAQANKGGTITPSGKVTVRSGASQKFTMQADAGYRIADIAVDGKSIGKESSYTFNNVTANHSITASFEKVADTVTVTLDANGGELKGQASIDVVKGGPLGEIAAPTRALHIFIGWYTRKSGGEQVTAETVINQSMTIYAQWGQTAYVETKSSNLHLRNTAGMNGKVLAKYPNGTKLAVIGEKGDWYHVIVKDRTGWMHKRYVRLEKK